MLFDWRKTLRDSNKIVHAVFALPAVVHFPESDKPVRVRHFRIDELVGQEAYQDSFVYSQAMLTNDQLMFDLESLDSYKLTKGLLVTVDLELDRDPVVFEIAALHPENRGWRSCDVVVKNDSQ